MTTSNPTEHFQRLYIGVECHFDYAFSSWYSGLTKKTKGLTRLFSSVPKSFFAIATQKVFFFQRTQILFFF